jgi:hypothetical protein
MFDDQMMSERCLLIGEIARADSLEVLAEVEQRALKWQKASVWRNEYLKDMSERYLVIAFDKALNRLCQ